MRAALSFSARQDGDRQFGAGRFRRTHGALVRRAVGPRARPPARARRAARAHGPGASQRRTIARSTNFPETSISARIRDLRKRKFGGYEVLRKRHTKGVWVYRINTGEIPDYGTEPPPKPVKEEEPKPCGCLPWKDLQLYSTFLYFLFAKKRRHRNLRACRTARKTK